MGRKKKYLNDYRAEELLRSLDNAPLEGKFDFCIEEEESYYETVDPETITCLIQTETPEDVLIKKELAVCVKEALNSLTRRESKILKLRFGIGTSNDIDLTLEGVGKLFGLQKERIRQIEAKALRKLRHPLRAGLLKLMMFDDVNPPTIWDDLFKPAPQFDSDFDSLEEYAGKLLAWNQERLCAITHLSKLKKFIKSGKSNYKQDVDEWRKYARMEL